MSEAQLSIPLGQLLVYAPPFLIGLRVGIVIFAAALYIIWNYL